MSSVGNNDSNISSSSSSSRSGRLALGFSIISLIISTFLFLLLLYMIWVSNLLTSSETPDQDRHHKQHNNHHIQHEVVDSTENRYGPINLSSLFRRRRIIDIIDHKNQHNDNNNNNNNNNNNSRTSFQYHIVNEERELKETEVMGGTIIITNDVILPDINSLHIFDSSTNNNNNNNNNNNIMVVLTIINNNSDSSECELGYADTWDFEGDTNMIDPSTSRTFYLCSSSNIPGKGKIYS